MIPIPDAPEAALVFTGHLLDRDFAKTCHGLLRGSSRFRPVAVLDTVHAGRDAGEVMDGRARGVPVFGTLDEYLAAGEELPDWFVVGVAFSGGALPEAYRPEIEQALNLGMNVVCGLHQFLGTDPGLAEAARRGGGRIIDIRRPPDFSQLRFWTGAIYGVRAPVVGVLGTDCAVGKRTTARFIWQEATRRGIRSEMIYTGQTGWMQGYPHGLVLDATPNDFVSGELERAVVEADRASSPDLILVEGQGSLRNPSGPCGSEIILSANARHIILQHAPGRSTFVDQEAIGTRLPHPGDEIDLIHMYGAEVLAVTLNGEGMTAKELDAYQVRLQDELGIPVVQPLRDGVAGLMPLLQALLRS